MGSLYLDKQNLTVKLDGQALALYEHDRKQGTVPLQLLERVVIKSNVQLESRVLGALASQKIGLLVLGGRSTQATAMLAGTAHSDATRRLGQYRGSLDEMFKMTLARWLVLTKVRAQQRLLQEALNSRADLRYPLTAGLTTLKGILQQLRAEDATLPVAQLRGLEGAAAAAHFAAYQELFAESLQFTGRRKRPPPDPVNACLSLGYTLCHYDAVRACHITGLDTMLGFYHEPAFNRDSLACDLMEPLRPVVERWVWQLFKDRLLRMEHFSQADGNCQLNKTGRQHFYGFYESRAAAPRRLLRRYGYALAKRYQTLYQAG